MVAHLVRLQLALQKAGFRRNPWAVVGLVLGLLYALGFAAMMVVAAYFLRGESPALIGGVCVAAGAVYMLGWCLLPLLAFGVDETLDPGRFALLPVRARDLMPGLLVGGFISASGVMNLLAGAALTLAWSGRVLTALVAAVCGLVGIVTCFLFSRVLTSALASGLVQRRSRDLAAVVLGVVAMTFGLAMQFVSRAMTGEGPERMLQLLLATSRVAGWTPFGWVWAVPGDLAAGHVVVAAVRFLLAAALATGLWRAWAHFLDLGLTSPIAASGDGAKVSAHSRVDRLFPATPRGAIAARSLRYWRRDSRHVIALVSILIMPALVLVPMFVNGGAEISPLALLFAPGIIALMAGIGMSNEIAYDGSALWTHISTGIRGFDDRAGRAWALSWILVPILVLVMIVVAVLCHGGTLVVAMIGATAALYLCSLGVGSWAGARFIVPTPPPGERNTFNRGQSGGATSLLNLLATWAGSFGLALPALALAVAALWVPWLAWVSLPVGVGTGALVLWLGLRQGGRRLDTHWPEALKAATYEAH